MHHYPSLSIIIHHYPSLSIIIHHYPIFIHVLPIVFGCLAIFPGRESLIFHTAPRGIALWLLQEAAADLSQESLARDDECMGASCAANALQLQGRGGNVTAEIRPHRRCWGVIVRMALVKGYRFTWGGGAIIRPKPPVFDRSWRSPSKNTVKNSTEDTCSWTRPSKIGKRKV